jgi:hydrogenase-4 component F
MTLAALTILLAVLGIMLVSAIGVPRIAAFANALIAGLILILTLAVAVAPLNAGGLIAPDRLGAIFGAVTGLIGFTTALSNIGFVAQAAGAMKPLIWRIYHALFQATLAAILLALYASNLAILWVALEAATIIAALGVSLPGTPAAIEAAWKYIVLCGVGIALALFGTALFYLSAMPVLGQGVQALQFAALTAHAATLNGQVMNLAFLLLLIGYGTKAGLAPLHGWLPDAHAEGPAPLAATLGGLVLNAALLGILRVRLLMASNHAAGGGAVAPGLPLLALGLASVLLASFSLWNRRDARRFFGFSSIEHSGVAAFAFGLGGPVAIFGGLLHMILHSIAKAAVFQGLTRAAMQRSVGQVAAQRSAGLGQFSFIHLAGLQKTSPALAWWTAGAIFCLTGLPPFGMFTSEFIIISQTILRQPYLSLPLGGLLLICALAILRRLAGLIAGDPPAGTKPMAAGYAVWPIALHVTLVLVLGIALPMALSTSLMAVARALSAGGA